MGEEEEEKGADCLVGWLVYGGKCWSHKSRANVLSSLEMNVILSLFTAPISHGQPLPLPATCSRTKTDD